MAGIFQPLSKLLNNERSPTDHDDDDDFEDDSDVKAEANLQIKCNVIGTKEVRSRKGPHMVFVIKVQLFQKDTNALLSTWTVSRRSRAFEELHEKVCNVYDRTKLPSLPKKKIIRSLDPEYINDKKQALDFYLQGLLSIPQVAHSDVLCSFLVGHFRDIATLVQAVEKGAVDHAQELEHLRSAATEADRTLAATSSQVAVLKKALDDERERAQSLQSSLLQAQGRIKQLESAINEQKSALTHKEEENSRLKVAVSALNSRMQVLEADVSTMPEEIRRLKALEEEKSKAIQDLQEQLKLLKSQKKVLIHEIKRQKEAESQAAHPPTPAPPAPAAPTKK